MPATKKTELNYTFYSASPEQRKLSWALLVIGVLLSFILIGLILLVGFLKVRFARRQVGISEDEISIREASWLLLGDAQFHSRAAFPAVTVLSKQVKSVTSPAYFFITNTKWSDEKVFRLALLSEDHRKKIELQEFSSSEAAMAELKHLVKIGFRAEKFNPRISEESKRIRERRKRR